MTALRFSFDPIRSCVWVDARSSLLPIKTQTRGLRGWIDVALRPDGAVDLDVPVQGRLEISVDRLSSGNQLYDRELRRRIDARRHPLIIGQITGYAPRRWRGATGSPATCRSTGRRGSSNMR